MTLCVHCWPLNSSFIPEKSCTYQLLNAIFWGDTVIEIWCYVIFYIIHMYVYVLTIRMFHRTTICWGDNTDKNFVPPIKTRSPVVKAVKLLACRQAKSPLKITTLSAEERSASHIYWQLTKCEIHKWLCLPARHQFD